jgi:chromosome segregation ATPase
LRRASLRDIIANAINAQSKEKFAIELNASHSARKRVRLILRSLVKRSRFTLRSSQSQNELERLQTKLRRLEEELQRLQKAQQTFATDVKSSLEKLRTFREDSQHEIHNSRKEQNDSQEKRNALQEERNDSRKKRNVSQEHIEKKEIRILQKLLQKNVALSKKEYTESSQQMNVRENVSKERNRLSQNFEFVQENSRRIYNASETIYRVAYISK